MTGSKIFEGTIVTTKSKKTEGKGAASGEKTRRPRILPPPRYVDQLIMTTDTATGAKIRALAGRARCSIAEIMRELVAEGWKAVEKRHPPAEPTPAEKAAATRAARIARVEEVA